MYLKSIEVNGFKSFAHKMLFSFEHGITGIVGPNGSGKSNVADAVRWVLGEQSAKQLRGAKMEDVIFSGTEIRKPMGSAYVAITLDNSDRSLPIDFDEVTVARRVYRSGESEYIMNGSACRRKDIVELFFDTGIGKEGYSIIGQGQVDQILNGKPEDRRELFDEAAGIIKYKKNKAETQKSLDIERENLTRVTDILTELERQVGPLKRQSERAKEYLVYRDELKEKDIRLFLLENQNLEAELKSLDEKIQIAEDEMKQASKQQEDIKKRYEDEETQLSKLKEEINRKTEEISDGKISVQRQEGEIKVLKEQINTERTREEHADSNRARFVEEIEAKEEQLDHAKKHGKVLEDEYEKVKANRQEKEKILQKYQAEIMEAESKLESLRSDISLFSTNQMDVLSRLERSQTVGEQMDVRIEYLTNQANQVEEQRQDGANLLKEKEEEIKKLQEEKEQIQIHGKSTQRILEELRKERQDIDGKFADQKEKYHRLQSNYETLRNMAERYDGYGFGIKKVMEQKQTNPGIVGVVADIMKVNGKYETAIETALGGTIQNIVTDKQNTAKKMIEFLKSNRYGRVTFLPLDAVKGRAFHNQDALKEPGVVGLANQLVQCDKEFDGLFASLLGQVLVVETMDAGIAIARKYRHSFRIVTLEGDALNRGGSMSGGAFKNKSNLLGRNREVKDIEGKLSKMKEDLASLQKVSDENAKKLNEHQEMVVQLNQQFQEKSLELNTQEMSLESLKKQDEDKVGQRDALLSQIEELKNQKDTATQDATKLLDQKAELESANEEKEHTVAELEEKLSKIRGEAEEHSQKIAEVHMESSQLEQKLEFATEEQERITSEMNRLKDSLKELEESTGSVSKRVKELEKQISDREKSIVKVQKDVETFEEALVSMREEVNKRDGFYKEILKEREEILERVNGYDKELFRLTGTKEKQMEKQQELLDYMWDNYEVAYHQAEARAKEEITESLTSLREQISEIKSKIRGLGPVNVNAIEDYKEVSERYEFLQKQHEDIQKAEEHLVGLMEELEEAMRKQFDEKFADIQRMFQKVFVELFGGGTAKLELTEGDVLEAGVRIIAQPPGKKLQNMMQLSGGEKALTAISLLFAIQNLKPSPFCLLDEIEAALDDSNVTRFAQYLHKLTRDTQFIVITHRRGTMMAADVLYGITMQEKGVSTQVSVSLIEDDLDE